MRRKEKWLLIFSWRFFLSDETYVSFSFDLLTCGAKGCSSVINENCIVEWLSFECSVPCIKIVERLKDHFSPAIIDHKMIFADAARIDPRAEHIIYSVAIRRECIRITESSACDIYCYDRACAVGAAKCIRNGHAINCRCYWSSNRTCACHAAQC